MTTESSDQALGAYLSALRASARLDLTMLARRVSLSAAQVSELENGRNSLFYNRSIRLQAARKIILHLGGDLAKLPADSSKHGSFESVAGAVRGSDISLEPSQIATSTNSLAAPARLAKTTPPAMGPVSATRSPLFMAAGLSLGVVLAGMAYVTSGHLPFNTTESTQALQANGGTPPSGPVAWAPETSPVAKAKEDSASLNVAAASLLSTLVEAPAEFGRDTVASKTSGSGESCELLPGQAPIVQPPQARKSGDMVYAVSQVSQVLCVVDANGRSQVQRLEAGQGQSFYGQPPWQVVSSQLQQTQLYFQGWKVRLPAQAQDRVQLVELR